MADDFDRSIGGLIAVAMQSTMVAFVVAIAALASLKRLDGTNAVCKNVRKKGSRYVGENDR